MIPQIRTTIDYFLKGRYCMFFIDTNLVLNIIDYLKAISLLICTNFSFN